MKVCVVVTAHWEGRLGGSQLQARGLVEKLAADGHEIFYLAHFVRSDFKSSDHVVVPLKGWGQSRVFDSWALYRALVRIRPDVIYQRVGGAYTAVCAYYARRENTPMVWHVASDMDVTPQRYQPATLNPLNYLERVMREYGLRHTPYIVAQTDMQARLLQHHYHRDVDSVIRNYHPEPRENCCKGSIVKVVWIANLKPVKRPEKFIQLARDMCDVPNVQFLIIGRPWGPEDKQQDFLDEVESVRNLEYLGSMPNEQVNETLGAAHILVNTSSIEGFSNTFIQAWMREVPVLSLDVNPDGVLSSEQVGFCANSSYDELLAFLRKLTANPRLLSAMGKQARDLAASSYSLRNLDLLVEFIEQKLDHSA